MIDCTHVPSMDNKIHYCFRIVRQLFSICRYLIPANLIDRPRVCKPHLSAPEDSAHPDYQPEMLRYTVFLAPMPSRFDPAGRVWFATSGRIRESAALIPAAGLMKDQYLAFHLYTRRGTGSSVAFYPDHRSCRWFYPGQTR